MKTSVLSALSALLVVILLFPGIAIGQAPILTADCTQDAGCLALKEQAAEYSKSGDLVEALRLYKLAYEVRSDPRLLFNIARLLHKQGKSSEAVPYYQKFIDAPIQDEEQLQKARGYLEQIQASTATPAQKPTENSSSYPTTSLPAETLRVDAPPAKKPVYKKWWFWVVMSGSVLAASAITAGVIFGTNGRGLPANTAMFMF